MGRSVEVPSDALLTVYPDWTLEYEEWAANRLDYGDDPEDVTESIFYNDWESQTWHWDGNLEWFIDSAMGEWQSLYAVDDWLSYPYRESRIILQNDLVQFVVSEYCGITAVSIVTRESEYGSPYQAGLAKRWVKQIEPKFRDMLGGYEKIGTFSNGESIYGKVSA